jgi:CRP/FNR family cyclic AMP-dependent transcriptional regulator
LLLAGFGKEGSPKAISPNMSQETLAEMIGTTRSRVSYFMNKFRKLGLIDYDEHIDVHNSLLTAVLHDKRGCASATHTKTLDSSVEGLRVKSRA